MKCQVCVSKGLRSKVFALGSSTTLMGYNSYYDEDGKPHNHDPNVRRQMFCCSNGHDWSLSYKAPCQTCGEDW